MESYCVIQFKDKQEKVKILTFLGAETEAEFKMTTDLKKFVAEKFSVKITDYIEMKDQATDMSQEKEIEQIKTEIEDQDVVIIPSTINIATEQALSPSLSNVIQPMPIVANQEKEVEKEVVVNIADVILTTDCVTINNPAVDVSMYHNINITPPTTDTNNIKMRDQSTEMSQEQEIEEIKTEAVDQDVVVISPTINITTEQAPSPSLSNVVQPLSVVVNKERSTHSFSIPGPIFVDQPIPVIDNTQNLMYMDNYGTYVPYLERPVEPKEEIIDNDIGQVVHNGSDHTITVESEILDDVGGERLNDTVAVVDTENHQDITNMSEPLEDDEVGGLEEEMIGNDSISVEDVLMENQVDIPFTSMAERLRSTKKQRYTTDNKSDVGLITNDTDGNIIVDMQNQADTPSSSFTRRTGRSTKRPRYSMAEDKDDTEKKVPRNESKKSKCSKCGTKVNTHYSSKMDHVAMHTDIMKFECLVDGCGVKCKLRGNMTAHMRAKHPNQLNAFANIELTLEQKDELDSIMKECFGNPDGDSDDKCQICHQNIGGKSSNSFVFKKEHALNHVDVMLYKCMENGCQFEGVSMRSVKSHGSLWHKTGRAPKFSKIELTKEQELEIKSIVIKCFPHLDEDME